MSMRLFARQPLSPAVLEAQTSFLQAIKNARRAGADGRKSAFYGSFLGTLKSNVKPSAREIERYASQMTHAQIQNRLLETSIVQTVEERIHLKKVGILIGGAGLGVFVIAKLCEFIGPIGATLVLFWMMGIGYWLKSGFFARSIWKKFAPLFGREDSPLIKSGIIPASEFAWISKSVSDKLSNGGLIPRISNDTREVNGFMPAEETT